MANNIQKKCENHCPNCGAGMEDIDWQDLEDDDPIYRSNNVCQKCGCVFTEVYKYDYTEFKES
jgi:transcription initiation factor TFIIIB Brf1 subunit/transcription initiation factor TFIIB